jgi:hypothetical protein
MPFASADAPSRTAMPPTRRTRRHGTEAAPRQAADRKTTAKKAADSRRPRREALSQTHLISSFFLERKHARACRSNPPGKRRRGSAFLRSVPVLPEFHDAPLSVALKLLLRHSRLFTATWCLHGSSHLGRRCSIPSRPIECTICIVQK